MSAVNTILPLQGKTALVTGSARGIGAAIAWKLATEGADVSNRLVENMAVGFESHKCTDHNPSPECIERHTGRRIRFSHPLLTTLAFGLEDPRRHRLAKWTK
jgi:hypothetical protein